MNYWKKYHQAKSIEDALSSLANAEKPAGIIAGGTDLIIDLRSGKKKPFNLLIDVSEIPELNKLELRGEYLFIGAGINLNQIISNDLIFKYAPSLIDACSLVAGVQLRNLATLGGNVAHAMPAGDGIISLLALGAEVEIAGLDTQRVIPMKDFFTGVGETKLDSTREILVGFQVPISSHAMGSAFRRIMTLQGVALPILNTSIGIERNEDRIQKIRIAVGPSGSVPRRIFPAEILLTGEIITDVSVENATEAIIEDVQFRTSKHRATSEYRYHLVENLFNRTLIKAWERSINFTGSDPVMNV